MPYPKSEMRAGAERRVAGAQARLAAVIAEPAVAADGADALAEALRTSDHATARAEASRLARDHPEVGEAWTALDEAIKFLAFSLLTDMADGTD
jgi:hypothetical protein